eukprot:gene125-131_t
MSKALTTSLELNSCIQKNLSLIYRYWEELRQRQKFDGGPILLIVQVDSIFTNWKYSSSCHLIEYQFVLQDLKVDQTEICRIFEFIEKYNKKHRRNTLFCLYIEAAQEAFPSPYIFIDWFIVLKVDPMCNAHSFPLEQDVPSQLQWIANHPLAFEDRWFKGSVQIVNKFWNCKSLLLYADPSDQCHQEILQLAKEKDFFDSIIEKKLSDADSNCLGFRVRLNGSLSGFIIYQIKNPDETLRSVEFNIQYLLVSERTKGLGSQMVGCTMKVVQNSFPGYTIIAFAESMPIESTVHFWRKKLNFKVIQKNFFEGVYYPLYKLYPGSALLETPDQFRF